jgi:hypothetical protein
VRVQIPPPTRTIFPGFGAFRTERDTCFGNILR